MPHFENAQIRDIKGGTFCDIRGEAHVQVSTGGSFSAFEILHRHVAESAFHDSSARFPPPRCHPDTRKGVISEIMAWHYEVGKDRCGSQSYREEQVQKKPILWLHAPAGAGKSAIAQSIAEHCSGKPSSLAASFFFSRGVAERNTEKHLVATLAYQIALSIPATKTFIENAVMDNPCIFSHSLETQFSKLVAEPLIQSAVESLSMSQWPTLILLDGLDEWDKTI